MEQEKGTDYYPYCLPDNLTKRLPLQALYVLAAHFVVQDMCYLIGRDLFSSGTLVDAVGPDKSPEKME